MKLELLKDTLKKNGIFSEKEYYQHAFSRNIGLLTQEEQERLSQATVAIPGMGGVGGIHLINMVRTGIGRFHVSDYDVYEPANVNRQYGARVPDFGRPKMEVMKEEALSINPFIDIKEFPQGITKDSVDEFLEGVDVVLDSIDFFALDARRLLFTRAREKGVHVITAAPLGFSSTLHIFMPDGMSFDAYFDIHDEMSYAEKLVAFAVGLAPAGTHMKYMKFEFVSLKNRTGPSLSIACNLCSALAATETVNLMLKRRPVKAAPHYFQFDPFSQRYVKGRVRGGNRNPIQRFKRWRLLRMLTSLEIGLNEHGPK